MGSYTDLSIGGYPLITTKSYASPEALTIFRETDKRVFDRMLSERNPLVWGTQNQEDDECETVVLYQCTAIKIAQRLDIMGFTLSRAREEFESLRLKQIEEFTLYENDQYDDIFAKSRAQLKAITFESYAQNLKTIMERHLRPEPFKDHERGDITETSRYILGFNDDFILGYFCLDLRCLIRLACALVEPHAIVEQDLTEVVNAGYYSQDDPIAADAVKELTSDYPANAKVIILAEGSSDTAILREALSLLYPHLADYYSFFDFGLSRSQGGAGQLVGIVKAFIATGISNRIVALLDNDTAGREAHRVLDRVSLPPNVVVLHYPSMESLRLYPTVGPTGPTASDVNGLAASIELYLGDDVLSVNGSKTPVQWRGFSEVLGAYHGEIMHKQQLQEAFWRKIERCKNDPAAMRTADWSGLDAILKNIFSAFEQSSSY